MLIHATPEDLAHWTGAEDPPPRATSLLRSASILVTRATLTARYDVTASGHPADPEVAGAFRDATCAQVATWTAAGIDPDAGAAQVVDSPVQSKGIGSAKVSYDTSAAASVTSLAARAAAATDLGQEALLILAEAGLITARAGTTR